MLTGQMGRPGTGLHPLRGQNNVQGASDAGLIPMMFPTTGASTTRPRATGSPRCGAGPRARPKPGLTVVEIMHASHAGEIRGMYIMGENPAMSDPDVRHTRARRWRARDAGRAGHLLTETLPRGRDPAGVRVPEKTGTFTNTDRTVQLGARR